MGEKGGTTVDTRFCYMCQARFESLRKQLPSEVVILGLDEHTACILNFATAHASIEGKGRVHLVREGHFLEWSTGETFPLSLLSTQTSLPHSDADSHSSVPLEVLPAPTITLDPRIEEDSWAEKLPPSLIEAILAVRTDLRHARQWQWADQLRAALAACDIVVEDTPTGSRWHLAENE